MDTRTEVNKGAKRLGLGMLTLKRGWFLKKDAMLILVAALCLLAWASVRSVYPFLSANDPPSGEVMVVDAWMPTYDLMLAASTYGELHPKVVLAVAGSYKTDASDLPQARDSYAVGILERFGVPKDRVHLIAFPGSAQNRTYSSAFAVKGWLTLNRSEFKSIELLTTGAHTRRSRLLYQLAFGDSWKIAVKGLDDPAYNSKFWWRSSEGFNEVISETAAYLYVLLVFLPSHLILRH
jgi:hypothetical protein